MIYLSTRAFVIAAGVALAALASTPSQASTRIQHLISPGGIEAWFVQDATVPLIAMEYAFAGGGAQDPANKPGVANLVGDLLDEGSGDLDSKTFHERLDRRAIELSFSATRDYFRGSLRMLRDNNDEAFDLLRMSLTSAHFDASDVERIRAQVISGLRRDTTNPNALAGRKFLEVAYGDHPYGRQVSGTLDSVPTIDVADMKDYVRRVLAKDTLKIAVVGDVDPATLGKLLDQTFGGLPAKASLLSAAAGCRRGSITKSAKSAGLPIRCMRRCCGWITPRCSSAIPAPVPTAPATPWRRSTRKSAASPRMARPSRNWTKPSRT